MGLITIAFFFDHPVLLSGMCRLFSASDTFSIVAVGSSTQEILDLGTGVEPDVVVVDLDIPGPVLDVISSARARGTRSKFVAFAATASVATAVSVLAAGASGLVLKGVTVADLSRSIRRVHEGETDVAPEIAELMVEELRRSRETSTALAPALSRREREVLLHLRLGRTNKEIAKALDISDKTVKHHMSALMEKLEVRNRLGVVLAARGMDISAEDGKPSSEPDQRTGPGTASELP